MKAKTALTLNGSTGYKGTLNSAEAHERVYRLKLPEGTTAAWLVRQGLVRRTAYRVLDSPDRIDLSTLSKLCAVLNCSPNDLLVSA